MSIASDHALEELRKYAFDKYGLSKEEFAWIMHSVGRKTFDPFHPQVYRDLLDKYMREHKDKTDIQKIQSRPRIQPESKSEDVETVQVVNMKVRELTLSEAIAIRKDGVYPCPVARCSGKKHFLGHGTTYWTCSFGGGRHYTAYQVAKLWAIGKNKTEAEIAERARQFIDTLERRELNNGQEKEKEKEPES